MTHPTGPDFAGVVGLHEGNSFGQVDAGMGWRCLCGEVIAGNVAPATAAEAWRAHVAARLTAKMSEWLRSDDTWREIAAVMPCRHVSPPCSPGSYRSVHHDEVNAALTRLAQLATRHLATQAQP